MTQTKIASKKGNKIKCSVCGKFIAYVDIPKNVVVKYTPDSEYTIEETEFTHKKCIK